MKDKGYLLPEVIDPPTVSFCIAVPDEQRHIAAFFGAMQTLANWWVWEKDEAHTATLVAQVWRRITIDAHQAFYEQRGCDVPFMLRQNADNSCLLEQSADGGDTWTTAFDFSICIPPAIQTIVDQVGAIYNAGWQPSTFAPNDTWVHSTGDTVAESDGRTEALCYAAKQAVGILCDSLIGVYQGTITLVNLAEAIVTLATPFAAILGGPAFAGFAAAASFMALEFVENMVASDIAILSDPDIRQFLACALYQQLSSRPVELGAFITAFDDDFTCRSADEQRAAELMNGVLSVAETAQRAYNGFSDVMASATLAQRAGVVPSCACPPAIWEYCLPLARWWDWSERVDPFEYNCAHAIASVPEASELITFAGEPVWNCGASGGYRAMARKFHIWVPSGTTVTEVSYSHIGTLGTPNDDLYAKRIRVNSNCFSCSACFGSPIALSSLTISGEDMEVEVSILNSGGLADNEGINQIKIRGTGVPLFGACTTC